MSNPPAFQTPAPAPLSVNVHALLDNCRRRAREHGERQFTGVADGLFGNELAVAMLADGKAVAPEVDPNQYLNDLIRHYGIGLAGTLLGTECMRLVYDTLRPHARKDVPDRIMDHFHKWSRRGHYDYSHAGQDTVPDFYLQMNELRTSLSQYGIRAVIWPSLREEGKYLFRDDPSLALIAHYMVEYEGEEWITKMQKKFPLA